MKQIKKRISTDFLYANEEGMKKRLSEWKDVYGKQTIFNFSLGNLDKVTVYEDTKFGEGSLITTLTKV